MNVYYIKSFFYNCFILQTSLAMVKIRKLLFFGPTLSEKMSFFSKTEKVNLTIDFQIYELV